jgi:hypothetical protein
MKPDRLTHPPRALKLAKLDNLALVPANLLPFKDQYQPRLTRANDLPKGSILILLPETDQPIRDTLKTVADHLTAVGQLVTTISATQLAEVCYNT